MMPQQQNQLPSSTCTSAPPVVPTQGTRTLKEDPRSVIADGSIVTGTVTPTNDNSNPQQGTSGIAGNSDTAAKGLAMDQDNAKQSQMIKQPRKVSTGDTVMPSGSTTPQNPLISNNGSMKDTRKLFVGGLPQDSKYSFLAFKRRCVSEAASFLTLFPRLFFRFTPFFPSCSHRTRVSKLLCSVWGTT